MSEITAHTQIVGLIGWPVSHSVSPRMHNAAFAERGLDWAYVPLPVNGEVEHSLEQAMHGLVAFGFRGANVTVPHKQTVIPYLDELTPAAESIGAVNTVIVQDDNTLLGDNTDAQGFILDMHDNEFDPRDKSVLVLGAGGSARAVVYGLADHGATRIDIANRTTARAQELAATMRSRFPACEITTAAWDADLLSPGIEIIVNCTSVGMTPRIEAMPWNADVRFRSEHTIYDLVYNPTPTKLVRFAQECGARAVTGRGMLVWQGALAFELWTLAEAPVDTMKRAIGLI